MDERKLINSEDITHITKVDNTKLINIKEYPVDGLLKILLKDKTTKKNIIFATDAYGDAGIDTRDQITEELLFSGKIIIQPRVSKSLEEQEKRTRKKAEVFTPSWVCNKMNNHCDTEWFGREGVFNTEDGQGWEPSEGRISFEGTGGWEKYVDSKRLEITCGEAPYIVSRYDAATGEIIPISHRIGILDRKLRVVRENTDNKDDWLKWAIRAFESVYGYEFQGDSLLIGRINLLNTFVDYMRECWQEEPDTALLKKIVNIITWNLWQMDGITGTVPYGKPNEEFVQLSFFDFMQGINDTEEEAMPCLIFDWRSRNSQTFLSLKEGHKQ